MLGELLGVSATVTSGGGSKADESPPPTGIFLFTHQQYLTNGAMQLVTDIYNSRRYQAFTRYVLEGIVQQQLEESDGNTT
ncbi:MAG: hypothetical protein LBJ69_01225, partial [Holosporales bacterium]|nr:hypothetical protein [Holosporales bacterium]